MERFKPYDRIAKISVKMCDFEINALKMTDAEGVEVFSKHFNTYYPNRGEWKGIEVPENQVICGIAVNTTASSYITRLSFSMATAENFIRKDRSKEVPKFITNKLKFGLVPWSKYNENVWPKSEDLSQNTKPFKLSAIKYKHRDNDFNLSAIQLVFTNN